jgi:hypothetical protein
MKDMDIELKRQVAAKECGLIDTGFKYNKLTPDDEVAESRFYCNKHDWKPDKFWKHFMYFASNCDKLKKMVVVPTITPKESFEVAMAKIRTEQI